MKLLRICFIVFGLLLSNSTYSQKIYKVLQNKYKSVYHLSGGLIRVYDGDKYGFVDANGKVVIPLIFDLAFDYEGEVIAVRIEDLGSGFIDGKGRELVPLKYADARPHIEDMAAVAAFRKGKKMWGFINKEKEQVIDFQYEGAKSFSEGLAAVYNGKKWGMINKNNDTIVPFIYDDIDYCYNGVTRVLSKKNFGYIDKEGNVVIPLIYDMADQIFEDGVAVVKGRKGNWALINTTGDTLKLFDYDYVQKMKYGLLRVKKGKRYGIIDIHGNEILPIKYKEIWNFREQLCAVNDGGKWGFIDKRGNVIVPINNDAVSNFFNGICTVVDGKDYYRITNPLIGTETIIDETSTRERYDTEIFNKQLLDQALFAGGTLLNFYRWYRGRYKTISKGLNQDEGGYCYFTYLVDEDGALRDITFRIGPSERFEGYLLKTMANPPKFTPTTYNKKPIPYMYRGGADAYFK